MSPMRIWQSHVPLKFVPLESKLLKKWRWDDIIGWATARVIYNFILLDFCKHTYRNCSHDFTEKRPTGQVSCILSVLGGNDSREGKGEKKVERGKEKNQWLHSCFLFWLLQRKNNWTYFSSNYVIKNPTRYIT